MKRAILRQICVTGNNKPYLQAVLRIKCQIFFCQILKELVFPQKIFVKAQHQITRKSVQLLLSRQRRADRWTDMTEIIETLCDLRKHLKWLKTFSVYSAHLYERNIPG